MPGEVSEWFKVRLSKSRVVKATVGSNPTLSANVGPVLRSQKFSV
jgi:hypothetical protein